MGTDEHPIAVIGRGESIAVGFTNPSERGPGPSPDEVANLETFAEEESPSEEQEGDVEAAEKPKKLSDERAAAIEGLRDSQGWVFPKVKVCFHYHDM